MLTRLCVFCGSSPGTRPEYAAAAVVLGKLLAERRVELVYGGAHLGLMGLVAQACLDDGGQVTGVIPRALVDREIAHRGLTRLHIVESMHERKALMADLADAFLALPGGFGTFEEFFEALTWSQLGIQQKPCALLNIAGYYDDLLRMLDRALLDGFLRSPHREMVLSGRDAGELLHRLSTYEVPSVRKWAEPADR